MALIEHPTGSTTDRAPEWTPSELRRVVIRLTDGEILQLGTAPNRDSALVLARTLIAEIEEPRRRVAARRRADAAPRVDRLRRRPHDDLGVPTRG